MTSFRSSHSQRLYSYVDNDKLYILALPYKWKPLFFFFLYKNFYYASQKVTRSSFSNSRITANKIWVSLSWCLLGGFIRSPLCHGNNDGIKKKWKVLSVDFFCTSSMNHVGKRLRKKDCWRFGNERKPSIAIENLLTIWLLLFLWSAHRKP